MEGKMDGGTYGQGQTDEGTGGQRERRLEGQPDGGTYGQGQTDGVTDTQIFRNENSFASNKHVCVIFTGI